MTDTAEKPDYSDLTAVFINCTLTPSPKDSHTDTLMDVVREIMSGAGVSIKSFRSVDHDIAPGVYPDMTEQGFASDAWPEIGKAVLDADILVLGTPIWLGEVSSECRKIIERLYAHSGEMNDKGQYIFYGKAAGAIITGNEDGVKHCAMGMLYSLAHIGYMIPPQPDAGWIGEIGPGPSYGDTKDDGSRVGFDSEFTARNSTSLAWNLMHTANMLKQSGGLPAYGNSRRAWNDGARFDHPNPEYR
ncbi:MAG: flavodoxin family protein [Halothiobacillus sp.]|jgi:multimeric flavodoxin WrbA|nr:flavodoxin family protein [Halothiobacillus sp.]